jgi:hypothetical protein
MSLSRVLHKLVHYQPQDVTGLFHHRRQSASSYGTVKVTSSDVCITEVKIAYSINKLRFRTWDVMYCIINLILFKLYFNITVYLFTQ